MKLIQMTRGEKIFAGTAFIIGVFLLCVLNNSYMVSMPMFPSPLLASSYIPLGWMLVGCAAGVVFARMPGYMEIYEKFLKRGDPDAI